MTSLSDFPPDVQAAAAKAHAEFADAGCRDNLGVIIARAIVEDRAGRHSAVGLTTKQHELLNMIAAHQAQHGTCPTYADMRDAMGVVSVSGIHRLIRGLEERGRIKRLPNRSRAITIIANPAN